MIPYWLLLLLPIWACVEGPRRPWPAWQSWLIGIALTLFIGLRHEVGSDWFNYIPYLTRAEGIPLAEAIAMGDPGYNILNWLFAGNALGIYGVNLVSGAVFSAGLVLFCRAQPRPWLALCLAIPYVVIVVAMGYSRQGVALGLIMPALLALERGRLRSFLLWMAAACCPAADEEHPLDVALKRSVFGVQKGNSGSKAEQPGVRAKGHLVQPLRLERVCACTVKERSVALQKDGFELQVVGRRNHGQGRVLSKAMHALALAGANLSSANFPTP